MFECVLSIEISTVGWILTKFCMDVILEGEGSWVGFHPVHSTPKVWGPKRESGMPLEPQPFICVGFGYFLRPHI